MSLLPFLAVAFGAGSLSLLARRAERASAAIGLVGLVAAAVMAAAIGTDAPLAVAGGAIAGSQFARLFLLLGCVAGTLVVIVALATTWPRSLPGATLIGLGAAGFALGVTDPGTAVVAATGGAVVGILVTLVAPVTERGLVVAVRELRALVLAGAIALLAAATIVGPIGAGRADPAILGLGYVAFAAAAAIRFGAIPFHPWAARVADAAPEVGLPLVMAWGPAAFMVIALAWTNAAVTPAGEPLGLERGLIVVVGAASVLLGTAAALLQDDIEHIVGYSIVADGGIALLGLAALDPAAWGPTRTWLLALVVTKTAFAAWAAAMRAAFGTRRIPELSGWATRAPLLAVALLAIIVAGVGWPGMSAFAARGTLVDLVLQGPPATALLLGALASVLYYGRLLAVGIGRPSGFVAATESDSPESRRPTRLAARSFNPAAVWRVNRTPIAAIAVLLLAGLSVAVAGGALGVAAAAEALPPARSEAPGGVQPSPVGSGVPSGSRAAPTASGAAGATAAPSSSVAAPGG